MKDPLKQDYINYRLQSASETLKAAKLLAENFHWNSAINRLYYTCFYAISALLYKYDFNVKSHNGIKHQFTLHFIKNGLIEKDIAKVYIQLFDWRQKGDYDDFNDFDKERTLPLFPLVEILLEKIQILIENKN
jgi:uncharacterized protein